MLSDILKQELEEERRKVEDRTTVSSDSVDGGNSGVISGMVSSELVNWLQDCVDTNSINKASGSEDDCECD